RLEDVHEQCSDLSPGQWNCVSGRHDTNVSDRAPRGYSPGLRDLERRRLATRWVQRDGLRYIKRQHRQPEGVHDAFPEIWIRLGGRWRQAVRDRRCYAQFDRI